MDDVFAQYSEEEFQFDTSRIVVKLFERGVDFVSRSEAKRIVVGLERFRHVIVDFRGIESVGQGFADEIFRVWAASHPGVRLEPINMAAPVSSWSNAAIEPGQSSSVIESAVWTFPWAGLSPPFARSLMIRISSRA